MQRRLVFVVHLYFFIYLLTIHFSFYNQSVYYLLFTNTLLALIPIEIAFLTQFCSKKKAIIPLILIWLTFLPNNFYLITDLFHISLMQPYDTLTGLIKIDWMNWYKLMMIFIGVFPTLFLGCWSIKTVCEKIISIFSLKIKREILYIIILLLNSIGIYLGRFERLNSWDTLTNPNSILQAVNNIFVTNGAKEFILQFFIFSIIIMFAYHLIIGIANIKTNKIP